ncbi:MAG TPA: hypothetical protein VGM02_00920 [Acidobacteriaceae bacterium]|jgi:hypothetical protein
MTLTISATQQKRTEKIERFRRYFGTERPEIYEWTTTDESLDFSTMSDDEVAEYLKKNG